MRKQTKLWKTKDGRKIRICDMSDSHLNNTIAMLEQVTEQLKGELLKVGYQNLAIFDGKVGQYELEKEIKYLEAHGLDVAEVFPIYENLVADRERRKRDEKIKGI